MIDSELEANEQGQLGRLQARALYRYIYRQLALLTLIVGFVITGFALPTKSIPPLLCIVGLIPPIIFFYALF